MKNKKLPIGIQSFSKLREENCYYVDKTKLILQLIEEGTHYFLSRPRRFGKSLLLDTIAELFEGHRTLFQGLYADGHWNWDKVHPVIRISFGQGGGSDTAELNLKIQENLLNNQHRFNIPFTYPTLSGQLSELIRVLHQKTGQRVVILVDEYDKPILDQITKPDLARDMRDTLRNLYAVIKDQDAHIQFAMLTGVSKFSKVSLFSGLNNLKDITVDARYSDLCGYTDSDLDTVFAPALLGLDREEIRRWYNGYNWGGVSVYNPFDVLLLLDNREFRPYWFESGTPTFLVDFLTKNKTYTPELGQLVAMESLLSAFDVDHIAIEAMLFQTGYLTIASQSQLGTKIEFTLKYPNLEVASSLNGAVLQGLMAGNSSVSERQTGQLYKLLRVNDFQGLERLFKALFASIPHDWYLNNAIDQYEGYYASVFYSHFAALGLDITLEDSTSKGRIDMTVCFNQNIYLFEFKVVEEHPNGKALAQLKERRYADKYQAQGLPIHLIGIEFSKQQRSVVGFEVESM